MCWNGKADKGQLLHSSLRQEVETVLLWSKCLEHAPSYQNQGQKLKLE